MKEIKKAFSRTGFAYAAFMVVMILAQIIVAFAVGFISASVNVDLNKNAFLNNLFTFLPIWLIGAPCCVLALKKIEKKAPEKHKLSFGSMFKFYAICMFLMSAGGIIGNIFAGIFSGIAGSKIENSTGTMLEGNAFWINVIFVSIFAPIFEELVFRKLLIDSVGKYTKKYTIFLSGILFALFHMNIYQFFYTFALGTVLAYIYTISGKIHYTIILHALVNLTNGTIASFLNSHIDEKKLDAFAAGKSAAPDPWIMAFGIYSIIFFALIITGLILFIKNIRKMKVNDSDSQVQKSNAAKTVYLNSGIIVYIIISVVLTAIQIILKLR